MGGMLSTHRAGHKVLDPTIEMIPGICWSHGQQVYLELIENQPSHKQYVGLTLSGVHFKFNLSPP
jgi:hypothetical protein